MHPLDCLAAMTSYGWRPGWGDPSLMGWTVFAAYLVSAALSCRAGLAERVIKNQARVLPAIWFSIAALLLLLACNKQLDLHNAITSIGRRLAREQGWYRDRRVAQLALVALACATSLMLAGMLWLKVGRPYPRYRLPLLASAAILGFILIRMAAFHHIDQFFRLELLGNRFHTWVEAPAAAFVGLLAFRAHANATAQAYPPSINSPQTPR